MAEYNEWMDVKIYDVCLEIPDELRKKDMGAFFKSIHSTQNHIYFGLDMNPVSRIYHGFPVWGAIQNPNNALTKP
jgi:hypothetical protein